MKRSKAGKTVGWPTRNAWWHRRIVTAEARRQSKPLLPIDSEHNAVHQCLRGGRMEEVERIWLTASGGPFLYTPKSQFSAITVEAGAEPSHVEKWGNGSPRLGNPNEQGI